MKKKYFQLCWPLLVFGILLSGCEGNITSSSSIFSSSYNSSNSFSSSSTSSSSSTADVVKETLTITNKSDLLKEWTCLSGGRYIQIQSSSIENISKAVEDGEIIITSSNEKIIEVFGQFLNPVGEGTSIISIKKGDLVDSVEVTISEPDDKSPRFFLDYNGHDKYATYVGTKIKLPNYSCFDYHNQDISHLVTVTSDLDKNATFDVSTGEFLTNVKGHHNVTYSIETDGLTASKTIPVDVYTRILAEDRGGSYQMTVDKELSDNPEIYATNNGMEVRCFNLEPSKYYYAEAVFTKPTKAGIGAGFIHSYPNTNREGFIREAIITNNLRTVDMVKGANFANANNYYTMWDTNFNKRQDLCGNPNYDIDSYLRDETTKLAIARNGNTYYFWMNDVLLEKYASSDFANQDTVPGIILQGWETGINGTRAKNINFCNGEDAINKISALEGNFATFGYYRNDEDTHNSGSYSNNVLTYTTAEGQNYYNSIVGSNILLKGNTHISFRYTATSYNAGGDDYSIFFLSKINEDFAKDPNAKTSKIASWAIIHYNSFNVNVKATASQVESPWSYDSKFAGNGSTYHWDIKTWDIDIKVRIETDGTTKVTYKFTEVNGNNSASYEETLTSGIKMSGTGINTSWYSLFFQGHNKNSYTISNLVLEPLID